MISEKKCPEGWSSSAWSLLSGRSASPDALNGLGKRHNERAQTSSPNHEYIGAGDWILCNVIYPCVTLLPSQRCERAFRSTWSWAIFQGGKRRRSVLDHLGNIWVSGQARPHAILIHSWSERISGHGGRFKFVSSNNPPHSMIISYLGPSSSRKAITLATLLAYRRFLNSHQRVSS